MSSGTWTLTGVSGLVLGDAITAKALSSSKTLSNASNIVEVSSARSCYTPAPVINSATNSGNIKLNISWTPPTGSTYNSTDVQIKVYRQTAVNTFTYTYSTTPQYYPTSGTFLYLLGGNGNLDGIYVAEALWNGCSSGYGNTVQYHNSAANTDSLTLAPIITTTTILATNTTARTVTVRNSHTSSATLTLYVNGALRGTSSAVAANATYDFSLTNLYVNDTVVARAQGAVTTNRISVFSNKIGVTSSTQSDAPSISGSYSAGSGKTVTGTSGETPGSTIYLYKTAASVTTQLGTTTVDGFGNWQITGLNTSIGRCTDCKSPSIR